MKLLILSILWFPIVLIIVFLSLSTLLNNQESKYEKQLTTHKSKLQGDYLGTSLYDPSILSANQIPNQDARIIVLKKFLKQFNSPLINYVEDIIKQSDVYGIDYALIPAIAMQESGGCKVIPPASYNCWGIGIYGDKKVGFKSYSQAIAAVAKIIKEAYIKKGLTNPTLLEDRWTPSSIGNWSYSVNYFIGKIREYEKEPPSP